MLTNELILAFSLSVDLGQIPNSIHNMSIPATQTVQYYTTRDGTPVAIAQKSLVSSASGTGTTETVVPVTSGTTTASFHINADTLQLIGLSGALPNSNLFVNYPHTMWERDAEGNRIPIQVPVPTFEYLQAVFRIRIHRF